MVRGTGQNPAQPGFWIDTVHAGLLAGAICPEQAIDAGEAIGMHHALVSLEMG